MSRGGGRGGFRGGRGGGASGRPEAPMGMMTYQEVQGVAVKEGGKLYPNYSLPFLRDADKQEQRIIDFTQHLADIMNNSPYRLTEKTKANELESYSDRYKPAQALTTTSLDAGALGLDKTFFPPAVWTAYFEKKKLKAKKADKKKKKLDDGDDAEGGSDGDASSSHAGSDADDGEAEPDFDEVEDEDDDYGQQYFDNGEGDDDGDGGGGGGGGEEGDMY